MAPTNAPSRKLAPDDIPWSLDPESLFAWLSTGRGLSVEQAVGLPALLGAISRGAHALGMIPQLVYEGDAPNRRRARGSWQWELLHRRPNQDPAGTPFAVRADLAACLMSDGNAYLRKLRSPTRNRVVELLPLDPTKIDVVRRGGQVVFLDRSEGGGPVVRTSSEIIHIRGFATRGALKGVSPITAARVAFMAGLKRQRFEERYYDNDARPGGVIEFPQNVSAEEGEDWLALWRSQHQGVERSHEPAVIGGGARWVTVPISLEDAQFVEAQKMTTRDIAAIYGFPPSFLGDTDQPMSEQDWRAFVTFGLGWMYTAIDQAMNADPDLVPPGSDLTIEHLPDALLKPSQRDRYAGYKDARQAGWLSPNEIRALENYPPVEGGDEIQMTPVGGAPNPGPDAGTPTGG
jgi:HK97 family phage portal protein